MFTYNIGIMWCYEVFKKNMRSDYSGYRIYRITILNRRKKEIQEAKDEMLI